MNRVLRDILSRTVDKDLEGIVDIRYDKSMTATRCAAI